MKPVERLKMCPNCDGRIPQESTQCPYCFAQLSNDSSSSKVSTPPSDPLSALYQPSYSSSSDVKVAVKTAETETAQEAAPFWSILMLSLVANLFTLGILQFFFSDHGILRLEMNASYWFLMVLVAAPLIYFGLKSLSPKNNG